MRTKKKEKRRRLTGEKTIRCCGQGENMEKYGFGVDVGGTSCKLGLFTDSGKLMEKWEIPTDTSEQGEHIIEHVAASLERRQRERGLADEQIIGVGIDTPGIAGRDGVVRGAVNLGWEACPVQEQLKMRLQKKVCVCNDANAAALGELWQGGGRGYRDMVMVTLGTGVGGAVILNGKVLAGAHGIAGEIGHMTVFHKETERCACGKYGCVEQYASAKGLIRITRKLLEKKDPYTRRHTGTVGKTDSGCGKERRPSGTGCCGGSGKSAWKRARSRGGSDRSRGLCDRWRNRQGGRDHPAYRTEVLQTRCTAGRCGHSV